MTRVSSAPNVRYYKNHDDLEEEAILEGSEEVEAVLLKDKQKRRSRIKSLLGLSK